MDIRHCYQLITRASCHCSGTATQKHQSGTPRHYRSCSLFHDRRHRSPPQGSNRVDRAKSTGNYIRRTGPAADLAVHGTVISCQTSDACVVASSARPNVECITGQNDSHGIARARKGGR